MEGGTTFHFVTDGIESALEQAKEASRGKDVSLAGGANVIQQCLAARLLDEIEISLVPILLGKGERLFDNLATTTFPSSRRSTQSRRQAWRTSDTGYSISRDSAVRQPRTSSGRHRETPHRRRSCRRCAR